MTWKKNHPQKAQARPKWRAISLFPPNSKNCSHLNSMRVSRASSQQQEQAALDLKLLKRIIRPPKLERSSSMTTCKETRMKIRPIKTKTKIRVLPRTQQSTWVTTKSLIVKSRVCLKRQPPPMAGPCLAQGPWPSLATGCNSMRRGEAAI